MMDKVLTDPRKLLAIDLKNKGINIDEICVPNRVYLLADDIFDYMVSLDCGEYRFPIGGKLWVLKDNPMIGFIKSMMCSPAIATQAEDLIACGVKELIHVGYAGGLQKNMNPGDIVITEGAYNDTAVARLYGFDYNFIESSSELSAELVKTMKVHQIMVSCGKTWTTDAGYHETVGQVLSYRNKAALCVEMEGVGLFTIAKYRECAASAIYIISDVFGDEEWLLGCSGEAIPNAVRAVLGVIA
ncbi:phosphorylase [Eisenbergiella tayi]|uniref:phosphorylase family protein n=1 Tax=Eisenbergiella tayi TaxID=1432052 RepID=UPI000A72C90C|nr:phosphorylase [Eisenbergiella tayi]